MLPNNRPVWMISENLIIVLGEIFLAIANFFSSNIRIAHMAFNGLFHQKLTQNRKVRAMCECFENRVEKFLKINNRPGLYKHFFGGMIS